MVDGYGHCSGSSILVLSQVPGNQLPFFLLNSPFFVFLAFIVFTQAWNRRNRRVCVGDRGTLFIPPSVLMQIFFFKD